MATKNLALLDLFDFVVRGAIASLGRRPSPSLLATLADFLRSRAILLSFAEILGFQINVGRCALRVRPALARDPSCQDGWNK